jgi:hypothetical protein
LPKDVTNEGTGQGVRSVLVILITIKQAIEFQQANLGSEHKLLQHAYLIFELPAVLCGHRQTFIKPTGNWLASSGSSNQDVSDFVAQHVFERIVRIPRTSVGKDDDEPGIAERHAGDPGAGLTGPIRVFIREDNSDWLIVIAQSDKPLDVGEASGIQ